MNITEMIEKLKKIKNSVYGDAELLFCDQNGEAHYDFCIEDWSEEEMISQILIKGCVKDEHN
jgi:hypothetical protein